MTSKTSKKTKAQKQAGQLKKVIWPALKTSFGSINPIIAFALEKLLAHSLLLLITHARKKRLKYETIKELKSYKRILKDINADEKQIEKAFTEFTKINID